MRSESAIIIGVFLVTLGLTLGGCALDRTVLPNSAVDQFADEEAEFDFWDDVATRSVVTNNDALHGLLLLATNEDASPSYAERVDRARQLAWVRDGEPPPADESATVGMMSVAVCQMLDIKGGLTMRLLGPSRRYCTREIVYLQMIPQRTEFQSLSGLEFVDLVRRVGDMMEGEPTETIEGGDEEAELPV